LSSYTNIQILSSYTNIQILSSMYLHVYDVCLWVYISNFKQSQPKGQRWVADKSFQARQNVPRSLHRSEHPIKPVQFKYLKPYLVYHKSHLNNNSHNYSPIYMSIYY